MLGTEILMGPSRWAIDLARSRPELAWIEGPAVRAMMVLLVAVSLTVSLFLTKTILHTTRRHVRYGLATILAVCFISTLYMWLNPVKFGNTAKTPVESSERFTVGPFPDINKLEELKQAGFTAVISLLHPAVAPFETTLIVQERDDAKKAGIEMIHLPMLPWISENKTSLDKLRKIAENGEGKYYLHCYLGKDRVSVAMRTIAAAGGLSSNDLGTRARKLSGRSTLARGKVYMPAEDVFIIPYPTEEEFFSYIIAANMTNVVCLMGDRHSDDNGRIDEARTILDAYNIKMSAHPISRTEYDPDKVIAAAREIRGMTKPVVVFDFFCPSFRTEALVQALRNNVPPIPPSLLSEQELQVGRTEQVAPNIITGPRPEGLSEFTELEDLGIKSYLFVGSPESPEAVRDKEFTKVAKFDWHLIEDVQAENCDVLADGGPWYVYGPGADNIKGKLREQFGPPYTAPRPHAGVLDAEPPEPVISPRLEAVIAEVEAGSGLASGNPIKIIADFIISAIPSLRTVILFAPFCLLYTYVCACYAGWLKLKKGVRTPYTRKVFHFLIFTTACFVQVKGGLQATILYGSIVSCCVLYAIFRGEGFGFYEAMARPTDAPHRSLYIFIPLVTTALGGVLANIFFQPVAAIGYLVGGWGDAIGEPVGSRWGKHKYKVHSLMGVPATRSIEGSCAVCTAGFLAAVIGLLLIGAPLGLAISIALICALVTVVVEALSTHGMDNLTVQVFAAGTVYFLIKYLV